MFLSKKEYSQAISAIESLNALFEEVNAESIVSADMNVLYYMKESFFLPLFDDGGCFKMSQLDGFNDIYISFKSEDVSLEFKVIDALTNYHKTIISIEGNVFVFDEGDNIFQLLKINHLLKDKGTGDDSALKIEQLIQAKKYKLAIELIKGL